jgi:hypothetical protein
MYWIYLNASKKKKNDLNINIQSILLNDYISDIFRHSY